MMCSIWAFQMQIQAKPKDNAVKQENDKQDELRRAALRVVIALQVIMFYCLIIVIFLLRKFSLIKL